MSILASVSLATHTPRLREKEKGVHPTVSAKLALNDWKLTTSTAVST